MTVDDLLSVHRPSQIAYRPHLLNPDTMPPTDATKGAGNILTKTKTKEKERKQRSSLKSQTERLKTVVRRLPPNLPEDVFWQSVQQWVTDGTVVWKEYHQGKFRKRSVAA